MMREHSTGRVVIITGASQGIGAVWWRRTARSAIT